LFISILNGASVVQLLQLNSVPLGARTILDILSLSRKRKNLLFHGVVHFIQEPM